MVFYVSGQVEFRDTDAAGVVYFANLLAFCHRSYEISLMESGIDLKQFFSGHSLAIPITKSSLDLFQPLSPGDRYQIELTPQGLTEHSFQIHYRILPEDLTDKPIGLVMTQHVCIDPQVRQRRPLPTEIVSWIERWGEGESHQDPEGF